MSDKDFGGPAFPCEEWIDSDSPTCVNPRRHPGMTLRQYAAIKLKVPDSGIPELDDMIMQSLRDEFAAHAPEEPEWFSDYLGGNGTYVDSITQLAMWRRYYAASMLKERQA